MFAAFEVTGTPATNKLVTQNAWTAAVVVHVVSTTLVVHAVSSCIVPELLHVSHSELFDVLRWDDLNFAMSLDVMQKYDKLIVSFTSYFTLHYYIQLCVITLC